MLLLISYFSLIMPRRKQENPSRVFYTMLDRVMNINDASFQEELKRYVSSLFFFNLRTSRSFQSTWPDSSNFYQLYTITIDRPGY